MEPTTGQHPAGGMTVKQARTIRLTIVGMSALSLVLIFQPFSLRLYSIGAGLVVLSGLVFNLVPMCVAGRPLRALVRAGLIILLIFVIVTALALGSALLYSAYMTANSGD